MNCENHGYDHADCAELREVTEAYEATRDLLRDIIRDPASIGLQPEVWRRLHDATNPFDDNNPAYGLLHRIREKCGRQS